MILLLQKSHSARSSQIPFPHIRYNRSYVAERERRWAYQSRPSSPMSLQDVRFFLLWNSSADWGDLQRLFLAGETEHRSGLITWFTGFFTDNLLNQSKRTFSLHHFFITSSQNFAYSCSISIFLSSRCCFLSRCCFAPPFFKFLWPQPLSLSSRPRATGMPMATGTAHPPS